MGAGEVCLKVDDYLDLYLIAGKLNDQKWQEELILKLKDFKKKVKADFETSIEPTKIAKVNSFDLFDDDDEDDDLDYWLSGGWIYF